MLTVQAFNKRPDLNHRKILIYFGCIIGFSAVFYLLFNLLYNNWNILTVLLNLVVNDLLVVLPVLIFCGIIFFILYTPAEKIQLELNNEELCVGAIKYKLSQLIRWAMVDLGDYYEIIINNQNNISPFIYIYISRDSDQFKQFLMEIGQLLPYDDSIIGTDHLHGFLRNLDIK
jgi:hypothetical protein